MSAMNAPLSTRNLTDWWARTNVPHQPSNCVCTRGGVCSSLASLRLRLAERTGISRSTLFRRLDAGTVTMAEADQWAAALGTSVFVIWPAFDRAPVTASLSPSHSPYSRTLF